MDPSVRIVAKSPKVEPLLIFSISLIATYTWIFHLSYPCTNWAALTVGVLISYTSLLLHVQMMNMPYPHMVSQGWRKKGIINRGGGPYTLPGLYPRTFQPSQRGFFRVYPCVWREREPDPEFFNFKTPGINSATFSRKNHHAKNQFADPDPPDPHVFHSFLASRIRLH